MALLAITADTWIITGLGFGIVLLLLFCLVFILQFFGFTMQKLTAPKESKVESQKSKDESRKTKDATGAPSDAEKAAIAMALYMAQNDEDLAAVAYALYLAQHSEHDIPNSVLSLKRRATSWNDKSFGMNNVGF